MKLQSGREVSNDLVNSIAENATFRVFEFENMNEGMDAMADSLEDGCYEGGEDLTEGEVTEILKKIEPFVEEASGKLRELFDKLVKEDLTKDDW